MIARLLAPASSSIKRKLMLIIMGVSLAALLLVSSAFVLYDHFTFRESMTHDIWTLADVVGNQSTAALKFDDEANAREVLTALRVESHILSACLYKNGKVFAQYSRKSSAHERVPPRPEADGLRFEKDRLVLFRSIVDSAGETIGTVYFSSDLGELHERLVHFSQITGLFMLLALPLTFLLSFHLQRIISKPIYELTATAQAVSTQRNYSLRAVKRSHDELGQLIDRFNEMLAQIQDQDAALHQAQDKLERRVEERTRDLQSEIGKRQRAQDALQQQLTRISLLNQITHVVSERQDLPRILNAVLRQLEDHLPVELGLVCLYASETDELIVSALREQNPKQLGKLDLVEGQTISLAQSGLGQAKAGKTIYLADTTMADATLLRGLAAVGMRCAVGAPLTVEDKLFGILVVARSQVDSFSSGECEFLRMLGEHVALAAHQARLHNQLETAYNELRQTQQTVMQQDRLRALGQMASGIAHDINNALSPVVGFAQMLLEFEKDLSPRAKKQLTYIKTAGEDVAQIVARLREFYRRREDREPLLAVQLNHLVQQVMDMTRPRWRDMPQSKGFVVEMQTELTPDLPEVTGTESELREALTNIVLNAVDAMPGGGKLNIRTRLGEVASKGEPRPTHVVLEVVDTGIGMDEETRRRCLEPFFSTKGKRGTGLGLAMVYGVMERHEGGIEVQSEPGKGTTVRLTLPLTRTPLQNASDSIEPALPPPMHILCIDDEPVLRDLVKGILESDGHTVQVADGGQTGIDAFRAAQRSQAFDVIITDLGMPFLDGRQVARILKAESPATPIIMLTGWGAFMQADGDLPGHVDSVLSKPPRAKDLRKTLSQIASRNSLVT
ncbi:MAG TPA: ATP-binding protein [Verrucomicrobiae bacterium]|nr:ATP-binding protein [Verrucomicrobiae bacterium]